jgi:hypothetical protein
MYFKQEHGKWRENVNAFQAIILLDDAPTTIPNLLSPGQPDPSGGDVDRPEDPIGPTSETSMIP